MHHVVLEQWGRGGSYLHRRDARTKVLATIALLVLVATAERNVEILALLYFVLLCATLAAADLPVAGALRRAAVVLPFCLAFALMSGLAGDWRRAVLLVEKSYLSSLAVLTLAATTPLSRLLRGLESLGAPRFLLTVAQFIYRYLFVISEQAQHMRLAALCRGGWSAGAAAGALATLFSRAYARAASIHRSMLARGFEGRLPLFAVPRVETRDIAFLSLSIAVLSALRFALVERL